jgi:tetratricopeptide (TPR) repeat protein
MAAGGKSKREAKKFRDLDIEIGFFEGILEMDPNYIDALELIAQAYTERGLYEKGLQADIRLTALKPRDPLAHYNLGCSYSLTGQEEKAADSLEIAILLGYKEFDYLDKDPDLSNLRSHPAYQKILFLKQRSLKARKQKKE